MVSGPGRGDPALGAAPRHDRGAGREPALENLVPAQQAAALGGEERPDAVHQVALQFIDVLQSLPPHPGGTFGAGAPTLFRSLVAADMDIFRREEPDHFGEHALKEFEVRVGFAAAREFGVNGQHLLAVPRHLDLGNHLDMQGTGVFDHFADVVLRVIAPGRRRVVAVAVAFAAEVPSLPVGIGTPGGDVGQGGVFFDFDAPSGSVGQVPVEAVELVARHEVELTFDELLVAEMARDVEHEAPVTEARGVHDRDGRNAAAVVPGQLCERLESVEQPCGIGGRERDLCAGDVETVAFGGAVARTKQFERGHVAVGGLGKGGGEESVRGTLHPRREVGLVLPVEVGRVEQLGRHTEGTFAPRHLLRGRDDARGRAPAAGARSKGESGKAKRDKRDFFHKVFRSGTTTNRDEPAKPEEGGASRGRSRKSAAGEQPAKGKPQPKTVGGRGQPEASAIRVRKPSGNGDSRKPEQPASGNRRGTGTAGNRNRRQTADRPRRAAIRGGFAARSRGSPKQEYEKRAVQPGLCRGRTALVGL